jgi:hypothetical protein
MIIASRRPVDQSLPSGPVDQSISQSLPSGDRERVIQSNENSENSASEQETELSLSVEQSGSSSLLPPSFIMKKHIERNGEEKVIERTSAEQSSKSKAKVSKDMSLDIESDDNSAAGDGGDSEDNNGFGGSNGKENNNSKDEIKKPTPRPDDDGGDVEDNTRNDD